MPICPLILDILEYLDVTLVLTMRSISLLGLAATVSAGSVSVPLQSNRHNLDRFVTITKRDGSINLEALNNVTGGGYYSEFAIGTPPQSLRFHLDTGSSDTWVNSVSADLCRSSRLQAEIEYCSTQFDPNESSTFEYVDRDGFNITYLDGRTIAGDYFNDTVTIGNAQVRNQQLGLATSSVRGTGLMGLGFRLNVASRNEYPTILDNMVSQGIIDTHAFSMYLNDMESESGSILFGAIDSHKYIGDLAILPIVPESGATSDSLPHYNVRFDGFTVTVPSGQSSITTDLSSNATAILDSGSTLTIMPDGIADEIFQHFGTVNIPGMPMAFADCAYADERGDGYTMNFEFDGKVIEVPMSEMIIDAFSEVQDIFKGDPVGRELFKDWDRVCMFGIVSTTTFGISDPNFVLLGDTFLRSAYVVYDQTNEEIGIAQANLRSTEERITEFTRNGSSIPRIKGVDAQIPFEEGAAGHLTPSVLATAGFLAAVVGFSWL
ncbi:aspartic-type endopeptidase-like protein [Paramyrothecium foliicola]|nr:aspartic-type endopeptidase-like protein [Paramyrothecium foliicola]